MSDELSKNSQDSSSNEDKPKKKFDFSSAANKFNPSAAKFTPGNSFKPGGSTFNPAASGQSFGYQDFSNYAQPASQPQAPSVQPSFDQFKPQSNPNLNVRSNSNVRSGATGGAKKVLSLGKKPEGSAEAAKPETTKAQAEKPKAEAAKETPKAESAKAEAPAAASAASTTASTSAASSSASKPKAAESKKAAAAAAEKQPEAIDADAVVKDQEKLDQEIVQDMFGDKALKEHMSIIFMGHVDAGKSTMGGNSSYLTGSVDKRTIEKYEREALEAGRQGWYLSWVMDTNKEERNEGKTIEVGRATFETDKRRYTILDAPGHKMYVPSMIGGASQADAGILVISARAGEYETGFEKGGQTREHAVLAKTQGVDRLVVVVNKMDDPTVNWSKERYDDCTSKLAQFLKMTGYTDVTFMPVSGYTGAGLKEHVSKELAPWYNGPSLSEWLDSLRLENRKINAPFMLPVSSKAKDSGTVVEGKIESGALRKGDSSLMMPDRKSVEVSAVYNESEQEISGAIVGEQVKIKSKGIDEDEIQIGYVSTSAKNPIKAVTRFQAQIAIVDIKSILTAGFSCVMHVHTAVEEVTFTKLLHKLEKGTNRRSKKPPAFAKKGMKIIAELTTPSPVSIEEYDVTPQLGRFTLRDQGQTIAIGKVTKILE